MTAIQVSLFQLDNYGPWTVAPDPRPEPDLQALQARLYADLAQAIGTRSGYLFYARFDNMIGVTNGIDRDSHRRIQRTIANRYPVTASVGVGAGETPAAALSTATANLQSSGSAQDATRESSLVGEPLDEAGSVRIAHFDVVNVTEKYTDRIGAYETYIHIQSAYRALMEHMYREHDALTFFVGGDNLISVCPRLDAAAYEATIDRVERETGVELQVGVGSGSTAHDAGMAAKHALEECRDDGVRIGGLATATGD